MAEGIKVFNEDGSLGYNPQGRLFRVIARVAYTSAQYGTVGFPRQPEDTDLVAVAKGYYAPWFTINVGASTVSWDASAIQANWRFSGIVEIWAR
ncbi:hypothetical protein WG628_18700 [Stenotrophomonas maltophilia]|nr:hypothetical protein [Stenotrophomonas maltophilia]